MFLGNTLTASELTDTFLRTHLNHYKWGTRAVHVACVFDHGLLVGSLDIY